MKAFWIVLVFLLVFVPASCSVGVYTYSLKQEDWIEQNMHKLKLGMTYREVEELLGYPSIVFYASPEDLEKFKQANVRNVFLESFRLNSNKRRGEIQWLYFYYRNLNSWPVRNDLPDPPTHIDYPSWPTCTFDIKTGKLIRIGKKPYWE